VSAAFVDPVERLSQGDLLLEVPSTYVLSLAYLHQVAKGKFHLKNSPPSAAQAMAAQTNVRETVEVEGLDSFGNAVGARRPAIVLSHDCELDKEGAKRYVLVAQVRPLVDVPDAHRDSIRHLAQKRALYLPPTDHLPGEYFADFRSVTTLRRHEVADKLRRVASLNEEGRELLQFQLFRFFVRKRLPGDWVDWTPEAEEDA
jgi:hypothetical protein